MIKETNEKGFVIVFLSNKYINHINAFDLLMKNIKQNKKRKDEKEERKKN